MELQGTWRKDEEGFMEFSSSQLQRLFEEITGQYHRVFNNLLDELGDEELAQVKAQEKGYSMLTDYKQVEGKEEFATTYLTPAYLLDVWYEQDPYSGKRLYDKGFMRVVGRSHSA